MAKKSTTKKPAAKPAKAAAAKPAKPAPKIFNNEDPEAKALFLRHLKKVKEQRQTLNTANADLRNVYKSAKAQGGFEKFDFDCAIEVETAEAEAKARSKIARRLQIARYMGSDLGAQLELFLEPDRTPASDRAYSEGQTASMNGETPKPAYAPETEQYRQFMAGYNEDQSRIAKGIKKTDAQVEIEEDEKQTKAQKAAIKKQQEADAKEFEKPKEVPTSGTPMTRAEFLAQQGKESHFTKAG